MAIDVYLQTVHTNDTCPHCGRETGGWTDRIMYETVERATGRVLERGCEDCIRGFDW